MPQWRLCVWARSRAPVFLSFHRSVNPRIAATQPFDSGRMVAKQERKERVMLKVVPDPPHNTHSLEDTLIQATDYALCAATVVHQA